MKNKSAEKRKIALMNFKKELLVILGKEVLELKVFGSQARGDFRKDSDIDVLIVLKSLSSKKQQFIIDLTNQILFEYGIVISPHVYSLREYSYLNRPPTVFMQILKREAVPL